MIKSHDFCRLCTKKNPPRLAKLVKTCASNDDFAWCPFLDVNVYFIGHTHKRLSIGKLDSMNQVS